MLIILDVPAAEEARFRAFCDEQSIQIDSRDGEGPAGGNPRYYLTIDGLDALLALGRFYFGREP